MSRVKSYGVSNFEELRQLFEVRASIADIAAKNTGVVPPRDYEVEADTWREAIELLRDVEFVGWKQR